MANPLKFTVSVLLICFFMLTTNALDPFDDPTLQIIREQDKEEGFDTRHNDDHRPARFLESLQCPDPSADTNTVELVSGSPYHMGCEVRITCHHGLVLSTGKPEVLINCIPFPHPCMCMAGWQTVKDFQLMYDLNCTAPNSAGPGHQVLVDREQDNQLDIEAPNDPVAESRPDMPNAMDRKQEAELAVDRTVNEIPTDNLGPDDGVKGSYKIISGDDNNNTPIETNIVPVMDKTLLSVHLKRQEGNIGEYAKREARAPEIANDNNGEEVSNKNDNRIVEENTTSELQKADVYEIENKTAIKIEENTGELENEIQKDVDERNNGDINDYKQTEIDYNEEIVKPEANEESVEIKYNEHVEIEKEEGDAATESFQSESETVQEERLGHEKLLNEVMVRPTEGEAVENQVDYEYPGDYDYDENAKEVGEEINKEKYDPEQISEVLTKDGQRKWIEAPETGDREEFHEYESESLEETAAHPEVEDGELPSKTEEVPQAAQKSPKYTNEEAKEVENEDHEEGFMAEVKEKQEIKHNEVQEEEQFLENDEVVEEEKEIEEEGEVEEHEAVEEQNKKEEHEAVEEEIEEHGAVLGEEEVEEHEAVEEENEAEEHEAVGEEIEEHEAVEEENEVEEHEAVGEEIEEHEAVEEEEEVEKHEAVQEEIEEHEAVKAHNEEEEHKAVEEEIEEHEAVVGEEEVEKHEAIEQDEAVEEQENVEDEENKEEEREEERDKYDGNEEEESVPMEEEAVEKPEEEHEEEGNFPNEVETPGTLAMEIRPRQDFEEKMVPRPEFPDDICSLPVQSGFCRAFFRRYFYNTRTSECEPFVYGGCGGNKNNFESLSECMQQCPTHFLVW